MKKSGELLLWMGRALRRLWSGLQAHIDSGKVSLPFLRLLTLLQRLARAQGKLRKYLNPAAKSLYKRGILLHQLLQSWVVFAHLLSKSGRAPCTSGGALAKLPENSPF